MAFLYHLPSRFVIELCEPIQVKQLDIANFELFSSTPKDFLVSISDRFVPNSTLNLIQCFSTVASSGIQVNFNLMKKTLWIND